MGALGGLIRETITPALHLDPLAPLKADPLANRFDPLTKKITGGVKKDDPVAAPGQPANPYAPSAAEAAQNAAKRQSIADQLAGRSAAGATIGASGAVVTPPSEMLG